MNKEVVPEQSAYFSAECCIYISKFSIPCFLFNIHLAVLFFFAVSILLTKIEIN
jgi:hypothetical protein